MIATSDFIPILQTAISPVILISGIGLFLITLTNRLGRVIDRTRVLALNEKSCRKNEIQLSILWKRAGLIRSSIMLASLSALLVALMVILLFITVIFKMEIAWILGTLFVLAILLLVGSLGCFLQEINRALDALKFELEKKESNS